MSIISYIKRVVFGELVVLDEAGNVLIPSADGTNADQNAHYTISQRLAEMREAGSKVGCIGCKMLTKIWSLWIKKRPYDHCTDALTNFQQDLPTGG